MRDLDVRLEPDHELFRHRLREWLEANAPGDAPTADQDEMYEAQRRWHQRLYEAGWVGIDWPTAYGGQGASAMQKFIYYEELARVSAPRLLNHPAVTLVGPTMMVFASEPVKQRYLRGILSAEDVWCQGFSEPGAGSDLASIRTSARLDGDQWVINGQKIWMTWSMYATHCALLCRTNPEVPQHKGLSMLIVDMHQPGIEVRPISQMTGRHEFSEVFFDNAVAPVGDIIGLPGDGWAAATRMLEFERSDQSFTDHARLLVMLDSIAQLVRAQDAAQSASGRARAHDQLVDLWTRCQLLRARNLHTARVVSSGGEVGARGSMTKLSWSELLQDIGTLASEVLGVDAVSETFWNEFYLETRSASIYSGTSEIQRNVISERIAGLPRLRSRTVT